MPFVILLPHVQITVIVNLTDGHKLECLLSFWSLTSMQIMSNQLQMHITNGHKLECLLSFCSLTSMQITVIVGLTDVNKLECPLSFSSLTSMQITVIVGLTDSNKLECHARRYSVSEVIIHPDYQFDAIETSGIFVVNDIALLKLAVDENVAFDDFIRPICLPPRSHGNNFDYSTMNGKITKGAFLVKDNRVFLRATWSLATFIC